LHKNSSIIASGLKQHGLSGSLPVAVGLGSLEEDSSPPVLGCSSSSSSGETETGSVGAEDYVLSIAQPASTAPAATTTAAVAATLSMTDKLSSPSSSSAGVGSGYSPHGGSRATTSSSSDEPTFVITQHPPFSVYSNESFEVEIQLELPKSSSPPATIWANEPIELAASLHYAKTGRTCANEATLMTEPMRITMAPSTDPVGEAKRMCRVRCMIRMDSIRRDTGAALEVRFAPRQDLSPTVRSIAGTATRPINIVNYKIRVTMDDDWEPIWYKDEGGRDKSMEVFVAIYDKEGQIKTGEQIPLQPKLCYKADDGPPNGVANQDVLRTLGSAKIFIDKDTGRARIRFRVEDVSKNHQGQDFVLQVGPDSSSKGFRDVAPAYTPAVNVRSKRNKRSRNPNLPRLKDPSGDGRSASPAMSRPRLGYGGDQDASPSQRDVSFQGQDAGRLREAMKGVISWADEVVNGLYPLQWQIVGYGQHPDGTPDYTRPYHNMPNPNGPINRILSMYSEQVRDNLRVLLDAVEQAGSSTRADDYMSTSLPREPTDPYGMMGGSSAGPMHLSAARGSMHQPLASEPARQGMHMGAAEVSRQGMHPEAARPGLHPSITSEAFRGRPDPGGMAYAGRSQMPPFQGMQMVPPHYSFHGPPPPIMDDYARIPPPAMRHHEIPTQRSRSAEEESRENEVEYVLAKQYKALRTGERLGFPAYSANKEILGFYRETSNKGGAGQFVPISRHRNDFGPLEILQATEILEDCIAKKSEAVHALKDWGSISNLLDHALVYDWSKDLSGGGEPPSTAPG
jgi:hypothetical protein